MRVAWVLCALGLTALVVPNLPAICILTRLVLMMLTCLDSKQYHKPYVKEDMPPWTEPLTREEFLQTPLLPGEQNPGAMNITNNNKVLWGHWHSGELPGFCKLAIQSWRKYHPDWHIIILSEDNYKNYVSRADIPSTFNSLKIQTRGDIMRSAVLRRYGGVYMDITYVVLKSFEDVWNTAEKNGDLYLTSLWTIPNSTEYGQDMILPNNCLLFAPVPNNPVLTATHKHLLEYFENPSMTTTEMKQHPSYKRVSSLMSDPSIGFYEVTFPYIAYLWSMMDVIYFNPDYSDYVKDHVRILPTLLWTFDAVMTEMYVTPEEKMLTADWRLESYSAWVRRAPCVLTYLIRDDPAAAHEFVTRANAFKTSSDFTLHFNDPPEYHLSHKTTQGRILRAAVSDAAPMKKATLIGAYPFKPIPPGSISASDEDPNTISEVTMLISVVDCAFCHWCLYAIVFVTVVGLKFLGALRWPRQLCRLCYKLPERDGEKLERDTMSLLRLLAARLRRARLAGKGRSVGDRHEKSRECRPIRVPSSLHFRKGHAVCSSSVSTAAVYSV